MGRKEIKNRQPAAFYYTSAPLTPKGQASKPGGWRCANPPSLRVRLPDFVSDAGNQTHFIPLLRFAQAVALFG